MERETQDLSLQEVKTLPTPTVVQLPWVCFYSEGLDCFSFLSCKTGMVRCGPSSPCKNG